MFTPVVLTILTRNQSWSLSQNLRNWDETRYWPSETETRPKL